MSKELEKIAKENNLVLEKNWKYYIVTEDGEVFHFNTKEELLELVEVIGGNE